MKVIVTMQEELDMSRLQVKQLNDLVSEADEIVKVSKLFYLITHLDEKYSALSKLNFSTGQRERGCPADRFN